jgi:hypothetical protein
METNYCLKKGKGKGKGNLYLPSFEKAAGQGRAKY